MNIELHIEELMLHGFAPGDHQRIADAVQGELARLFTEHGLTQPPSAAMEVSHIDAGAFNIRPGAPATAIGSHIAKNIYGGITSPHTNQT